MKADEPAPRIVKYGMATDETHRIVECHHALMEEEQQQIAAGVLDHNLRVACIAHVLLNPMPALPAPVAEVETVPEIVSPVVVSNLRERLGLN
ncbi:MAG: hypothetical protein ABI395_01855 [Sphingobium sp.]